jgi:hypothetical protein
MPQCMTRVGHSDRRSPRWEPSESDGELGPLTTKGPHGPPNGSAPPIEWAPFDQPAAY